MARAHDPDAAVGTADLDLPGSRFLVAGSFEEFRAGPDIELHGVGIELEPVGDLVFGDVDGIVRRERHVRHVIDVHLVVQHEVMIALAPGIAHPLVPVDDQSVDPVHAEGCGDAETTLSAADDDGRRLAIFIGDLLAAVIHPVLTTERVRVFVATWTPLADPLLVPLDLVEGGQQHPGSQFSRVFGRGNQPQHAAAPANGRLEREKGLDRWHAGARHEVRLRALLGDAKFRWLDLGQRLAQRRLDIVRAADRLDMPAEGDQVAPVPIGQEQGRGGIDVLARDGCLEFAEPLGGGVAGDQVGQVRWHGHGS